MLPLQSRILAETKSIAATSRQQKHLSGFVFAMSAFGSIKISNSNIDM